MRTDMCLGKLAGRMISGRGKSGLVLMASAVDRNAVHHHSVWESTMVVRWRVRVADLGAILLR
jgi:hypothetical protein